MKGQIEAGNGRIEIIDARWKAHRNALRKTLVSGKIAGVTPAANYIAAGEDKISEALQASRVKNTSSLLLIDGPTPANAKRVPASFTVLPLEWSDFEKEDASLRDIVFSSVQRIATGIPAEGGQAPDILRLWRSAGMSCAQAGETEAVNAGVQTFETQLHGVSSGDGRHWFWQLVRQTCAGAQDGIDHVLTRLLLRNTAWFSPYTGEPLDPLEAIGIFELMHTHWQANDRASHCYGAQYWNHASINAAFGGKAGNVMFYGTQEETIAAALESRSRVLSWAARTDKRIETDCDRMGIPLLRIEDGFLRSVGLGAGLARGAMLAADDLGIYYDPSQPSRLELLLKEYDLSSTELERAHALVDLIRATRISKYNFGRSRAYAFPSDKPKVLIPGQVADDAAIRKSKSATIDCANTENVNLDLLRLARKRNPDAFLVFKPHPDVETGLRKGHLSAGQISAYADHIASGSNIIDLIDAVDAVETFSSLSGFEALLRSKRVVVHGTPFYAGWGLCEELTEIPRRQRNRTLAELAYLSLVKYARTIDPVTLLPCTPEFLIARLQEQRGDRRHIIKTAVKRHASWLGRKLGI